MSSPLHLLAQICRFSLTPVNTAATALLTMPRPLRLHLSTGMESSSAGWQLMIHLQKHNLESFFKDQIWCHGFRTGFPGSRFGDIFQFVCREFVRECSQGSTWGWWRKVPDCNSSTNLTRRPGTGTAGQCSWIEARRQRLCPPHRPMADHGLSLESGGQELRAIVQKEHSCKLGAANTCSGLETSASILN